MPMPPLRTLDDDHSYSLRVNRSNSGFLRNVAKLGSILSHAGEA